MPGSPPRLTVSLPGLQICTVSVCAQEDERVLVTVGAKDPVPPGEVECPVVAGVHMVQVMCLRSGSQWRQADASCHQGMQPQRCLIASVSQYICSHLKIESRQQLAYTPGALLAQQRMKGILEEYSTQGASTQPLAFI